ncbi:MAG: thiamine biosynthesis protein ThiJ [Conexibacter sp.]|nr:thiamine biosynthesis protein ThiJ [Conexibacter sp.]
MPSMLLVLTASDHWTLDDGTRHPTGFWAEELLTPLSIFEDAGVEVTIATPGGARPTVDETSLSPEMAGGEEAAAELRGALEARSGQLASPLRLEDVSAADYDGVFIPGGHGPMEDLAVSPGLGALLVSMLDDDKVVASVCHGPAGLLPAMRPDGTWAFAGRTMSGFTNEEETQAGLADRAPWLLEDRMRESGGSMEQGPAWQPFSVVDGNLVTGQNPASSGEVARHAVDQLGKRRRRRVEVPPSDHQAFTQTVAELAGIEGDVAERATEATLTTLGEGISEGEGEDLARHLPDSLAPLIVQPGNAQPFAAEEFFRRVADREGTDPETAERHAAAVVATLARREGRKELHDMMSQLPRELRERLMTLAETSAARR